MGNSPSAGQVGRRPSQPCCEEDIFHGSHRNAERNRSRHCFVIRSQRPPKDVAILGAETRCCCSPPTTIWPCSSAPAKPRQRCCCSSATEPGRQRVCCSSGNKPQRCISNCPGNGHGGPAARRIQMCHPDAYPVPEPLKTKPMCFHPIGARCNGENQKVEQPRPAVASEELILLQPDPQSEIPYSDSIRSFQPAVHAINENCQDPHDPYYPYPPRSRRLQEVDPLVNFDLNRFDRDATRRGPAGRRRNVSIRTCVDYDYEPGYPARENIYLVPNSPPGNRHPQTHSGYARPQASSKYLPLRSRPPPAYQPLYESNPPSCSSPPAACLPRTRPPSKVQRQYHPRTLPGSYEHSGIDYVKCPYR
ncbi:uncharacterized protein LOC120452383 isoform X1 [Drosophila santomea]|uniref:uncharacterized protein LOC120452383 isoform X1 n=1 Tax=Drosophila santomea TaxID=129105 RepID=UPI001CC9997E|nr:uncharacterized protein LOC120452383 isoform X1 [Drosophila santomea]XP_043862292.1 uncharacterized protein LOC120452383 isoform X1 [Drosophila santomea]